MKKKKNLLSWEQLGLSLRRVVVGALTLEMMRRHDTVLGSVLYIFVIIFRIR
jgi:hypothetical protein